MLTIGEMLMGQQAPANVPRPLSDAQIMELRQVAERYAKPCPFKIGDLVMPRENSPIYPAAEPWLVIEVLEKPFFHFLGDVGACTFGARLDFRAVMLSHRDNTSYVAFWNESWHFEPYRPKGEQTEGQS